MNSLIVRKATWVALCLLSWVTIASVAEAAGTNGTLVAPAPAVSNHAVTVPAVSTNTTHTPPKATTAPHAHMPAAAPSHVPAHAPAPGAVPKPATQTAAPRYSSQRPVAEYPWYEDTFETVKFAYGTMHYVLGDRLHVGLRSTSYELTSENLSRVGQPDENHYVGTIDELVDVTDEEPQDDLTYGIYPIRNLGVEYRHDAVRARTFTDTDDNHSDGDVVVEGDVISAVVRLPLDNLLTASHYALQWPYEREGWGYNLLARFVPYVGRGISNVEATFEDATWWAHGYSSPASWESLGSPPDTIRNGHRRDMRPTATIGDYELYGISIRILDGFYFDVNYSKVDAEVAVDFYLDGHYQSSGVFDVSYESESVGVRYFF